MAGTGPLLSLSHVSKRYPSPDGASPVTVLNDVSLVLEAGESVAIVGPSGSGKSTLLNIIGTLDQPTSGQVTLQGRDLGGLNDLQLAEVRNHQVGFVFQAHFLLPQCTVFENVVLPVLAGNTAAGTDAVERAHRLLDRVGLSGRLGHRPGQLSGGECQRVAVVRALINQPALLLADEPTGSLDHTAAAQLAGLLLELNREEKVTLVLVTHARDLAARMGRVYELHDGRLASR